MNTIPIHETFTSFQGEGVHAGKKAHFIRTMGCPVKCPWCDSAGTWHPDWRPENKDVRSIEALAEEAVLSRAEFVVITGGEPCIQKNLPELCRELKFRGLKVHLETCGAFPIPEGIDWVTVSPKLAALPTAESLLYSQEWKFIVGAPDAVEYWIGAIMGILGQDPLILDSAVPIWLHPEWSHRNNHDILDTIVLEVVSRGLPFRAGWQLHKLYQADKNDPRSAPSVPLGGNPDLGM